MSYYSYQDLSGSTFITLDNTDNLLGANLKNAVENAPGGSVKIVTDSTYPEKIYSQLKELFPKSQVSNYDTNFFVVTKEELEKKVFASSLLDWEIYRNDFVVSKMLWSDISTEEVLLNLLVNSFAVNHNKQSQSFGLLNKKRETIISANLKKNFLNDNTQTFMVSDRLNNLVGCFSLNSVLGKECQLSNVAGISSFKNSYNGKKLPILCACVLNEYYTNERYSGLEKLTFSNSKTSVASFYSQLGFSINKNRKGWIVSNG
jgi:N-acetylglutamate synthase-like GNAT family acetyltransferase